MICDSCYYNWKQKAVIYDSYKHRNIKLHGGCHRLIFNQETRKFECPLYKKAEEVKVSRDGYVHYEIINNCTAEEMEDDQNNIQKLSRQIRYP